MFLKVSEDKITHSKEPENPYAYTQRLDQGYSRYARVYDFAVKLLPFWKTWIKAVVPLIEGPRVLEASFGTGYLLSQYAGKFETFGIDFNRVMVETAQTNLNRSGMVANLQQANVEALPYPDDCFDTVINTMAFSGYPDGMRAMSEFYRVLKVNGRLLVVDFEYPSNRNRFGYLLTKIMESAGDTIRDVSGLLEALNFDYSEKEIGGFGSVHLYVAGKRPMS